MNGSPVGLGLSLIDSAEEDVEVLKRQEEGAKAGSRTFEEDATADAGFVLAIEVNAVLSIASRWSRDDDDD